MPMELRFLSLLTAKPAAMHAFYRDVLQLPCLAVGEHYCVFQAGSTQLMFEAAHTSDTSQSEPFYHFAFDVPRNQLTQARQWLGARVELLTSKGETEVHFPDWNATAIYFHDPCGNIVELIARHNLDNTREGPFSSQHILRVSEIGWPVPDVAEAQKQLGLPAWRDYGQFKALGSETGLILLVEPGRPWLPTNRPAEAHSVSLLTWEQQGFFHRRLDG